MAERIGIYVCECGPNIKKALDTEDVVKFASELEAVVVAKPHQLLCAKHGQEFLRDEIKKNKLTRVVIAACSPKEHEETFMKVCQDAKLNPYMMQMANIREQVAWVTPDRDKATEKAKAVVRAAHRRVILHEPLEKITIDTNPDVLVLGAGVAGVHAALSMAQKGRKVHLVERSPCIGGKVSMTEEVYPNLECATCMMEPKLHDVLHNENIELISYAEVEDVVGFFGNFTVTVRKKASYVDPEACIGCDECFKVCPVKVPNEYNFSLDTRGAVYRPYPGAMPNIATIDSKNCLRLNGKECDKCEKACGFDAINFKDKDELREIKVGAIVLATGAGNFDATKAPELGYGKLDNVYTLPEFDRMLSTTGPTSGKVRLKNGKAPVAVAIIYCAGSRTKKYLPYCSGDCCMYSLLFTHHIKKQLPDSKVINIYSDLCLPGKGYHEFYDKVKKDGTFVRVIGPDACNIVPEGEQLVIECKDSSGKMTRITVDMVILATGQVPQKDAAHVAGLFNIELDKDGFFEEEHAKLCPVSTATEGVFIAGSCQGPMDIQHSVSQGTAAAGRIQGSLIAGEKIEIEPIFAEIDEDVCSGCKVCIGLCPYKAISFDEEKKVSVVNEVLCRGCGTCVAACPSGAITGRHFTSGEILAEIKEVAQ